MTSKTTPLMTVEISCVTGELVERTLTAEEASQRQVDISATQAAINAAQASRQAVLDRLGITADEARLLLS